jgi:hypothetical protein
VIEVDDLKDLLREKAEEMRLSPEIPPPVLRRARRRRVATGALAGAITLGIALGTMVGVRAALNQGARVPANPSPTLPSVASPTRAWPQGLPKTFVALKRGSEDPAGSLVLVKTPSGKVQRVIVDFVDLSEGFGDLTLTTDGSTLYYTQGTSACESQVRRVAVKGGKPAIVADGFTPAPSPDGRLLAYLSGPLVGCPHPSQQLIVRDLASGTETRWSLGYQPGAGAYGLCRLAWLPDSRQLAFNECGESGDTLRLLDVEADRGIALKDARLLGDPTKASLRLIGFHTDTSGIAVIKSCTGPQAGPCPPRQLVSVDPGTGEISEPLFDVPDGVFDMRLDGSGRYFLWATENQQVFGWDSEKLGEPIEIARGYSQATW